MRKRNVILGFLLGTAVIANGVWWSRGIPMNGAPDELDHYAVVQHVAQQGRLPRYGEGAFVVSLMDRARQRIADANDRDGINRLAMAPEPVELRSTYLFVPQLSYALDGWFCKFLGGASPAKARFLNTLWVALAAVLLFATGAAAWPSRPFTALATGACLALWPQITFVGAYVNDDAFALLAASAFVVACVWCQTGPFSRRRAAVWGAAAGLLFASKPYVLAFVPLGVLWFWRWARRHWADPALRPAFRRHLVIAAAAAALVGGPGLVRNAVLYGDPTGRTFMRARLREFVQSLPPGVLAPHKMQFLKPAELRPTLADFGGRWLRESISSFWARFGWMNIRPPQPYVAAALCLVGLALVASYARARGRGLATAPGIFALPGFALLLLASAWNSYDVELQPQGRYLLACVPPVMLQIGAGIAAVRHAALARLMVAALLAFFVVQNVMLRTTVLH